MKAIEVYEGSDGKVTSTYYDDLCMRGPIGRVAMNLFRASKCSARAKVYRGGIRGQGSYKSMAYDRKAYSMQELCKILESTAKDLGINYGWKQDLATVFGGDPSWVLYIDIPEQGQCSFHSPTRGKGPPYSGDYDGTKKSTERILAFCDGVMLTERQAVCS